MQQRLVPARMMNVHPAVFFLMLLVIVGLPVAATATPPSADVIVRKMRGAFEPQRPSIRKMVISVSAPNGSDTQWVAIKAQKSLADGKRTLLVLLDPPGEKGKALLIGEQARQSDAMWVYFPGVRRVRKILPVESYSNFFGTDFTYADLGFIDRRGSYVFRGEEERNGVKTYKVSKVSKERTYYSRIFTWVAADSLLPLEREYYDPAGKLWKVERFEKVTVIDGVPTPTLIHMKDVQEGSHSELRVSDVRFNIDIPDALFDSTNLSQASDAPLWQSLGFQTGTPGHAAEIQ